MFQVSISYYLPMELCFRTESFWSAWDDIHKKSGKGGGFFSSSSIVKTWLSTLDKNIELIATMLFHGEDAVGIMLFCKTEKRYMRFFRINSLVAIRTGKTKFDQWWPEYVFPLLKKDYEHAFNWWMDSILRITNVHTIEFECVPIEWYENTKSTHNFYCVHENKQRGGQIDLCSDLKWSKSIRRQLSQTERFCDRELNSNLTLKEIPPKECPEFMEKHKHWHIEKWKDSETPSGFTNPYFRKLLNKITQLEGEQFGRVFAAYAGDNCVGFNVILQDGKWAGFYLAGLSNKESNHWHIGIWLHVMIVNRLKLDGFSVYDFMAGDAGYKDRMMSTSQNYVRTVLISKKKFLLNCASKLKKRVCTGNIINK